MPTGNEYRQASGDLETLSAEVPGAFASVDKEWNDAIEGGELALTVAQAIDASRGLTTSIVSRSSPIYVVDEYVPGTDLKIDLSEDVPAAANPHSNRTLSTPFDELNLQPGDLKVGDVNLDFGNGTGDLSLDPTLGWDKPPSELEREPFPVDPQMWTRHDGSGDGMTVGSHADDWFDPADRMYTIGTVFQQYHTDPRFMIGLQTVLDPYFSQNDLSYLDGVIG